MEEIKNVIVTQKDIYDIIHCFNDYFKKQQAVFDETERLVNEEEANYKQWNDARFNSDNFSNYPEFKRQVFHNKRTSASLSIDTTYVDGSSVGGKSVDDFIQSVSHLGFDKMESITINMDISYYATYKADDYSSDQQNYISQNVYLKFREDSIYYSVSGEHCEAAVTELKRIILDKFEKLEPRLSPLITKRNSIKYKATLYVSFILAAILTCGLAIAATKYLTMIDWSTFKYAFIPAYLIIALLLNTIVPSAKLAHLYSLIKPKQMKEYSSYDKEYHNVDNIKDFVSYPEIQIGSNAKKSGVRETIKKIVKQSKTKNIIAFLIGAIAVAVVVIAVI